MQDLAHDVQRCLKTLRNLLKVLRRFAKRFAHSLTVTGALQVIELPIKHPELFESLGVAQPKVCACLQGYCLIAPLLSPFGSVRCTSCHPV